MKRLFLLALVLVGCQPPAPACNVTPLPTPSAVPARGFPIRLAWGGGAPDPTLYAAGEQAAVAWNQALGREVLTWYTGDQPDVLVTLEGGPVSSLGVLAAGLVVRIGKRPWLVRLDRTMPDAHELNVFTHELGHVLGADHSDDPTDVMYKYTKTSAALTPHDIALVQAAIARPPD